MIFLWAIIILATIIVSVFWWPREKRDLKTIATTAGVIGGIIAISIWVTQAWPATKKVTEIKEVKLKYVKPPQIIYKDRVVYRAPGGEVAPVDVKGACSGKIPVQLLHLQEQTENSDDENKPGDTITWVSASPVGSKVIIVCGQPGAFANMWKVGDVVQFVRGFPQ